MNSNESQGTARSDPGSAQPGEPLAAPTQARASDHSRLARRVRRRFEHELSLLPPGLPGRVEMQQVESALLASGLGEGEALRVTRQLVMERLVHLDCDAGASLADVCTCVSELAAWSLDRALQAAERDLDARHGAPQVEGQSGVRATLWVVGMGKLGAAELNVSSDIDLIYVYDADGQTAGVEGGRGRITNHEYFGKLVRSVQTLLADVTDHGFVFRVDLALRPNGRSGPPAISLDALEEYFQAQGREWERFAWLKARVVAPAAACSDLATAPLREIVRPFVFRRYLDYSVFNALRRLHAQIREHSDTRLMGRSGPVLDIKLGRGGIREIEFIVQLLQVVRAGQFPELRRRPTLEALVAISQAGLMPTERAEHLADAYRFLRRLEHRIQYLDDQQTHLLPTDPADLAWIASNLGFASVPAFTEHLELLRERVADEFDTLLGDPQDEDTDEEPAPRDAPASAFDDLLPTLGESLRDRLLAWREHPRVLALRDEARDRLMRLVRRTARWHHEGRVSEEAALRLSDWMEALLRRESYLALLVERPAVHERVLRLLGAARWPARYLMLHPGVIDELASPTLLTERFEAAQFESELHARHDALLRAAEDDEESLLNLLRRAHHAEMFRTLARDVEGSLTVEQVADDLSALADATLRVAARWCWSRLRQRHRDEPQFAIIGYGKLGGKELGYGSDLDIVFVHDDDDEGAPEAYAAFVRKFINWLTVKTGEGDLYEIDTALRPNGSSGLLITSFEAYADYQQQRGSNTAWTWEHQAMTRARFVLGAPHLVARFEAVREAVICAARDQAALRQEIKAMRERVRGAHPDRPGLFDVKHSIGGMVDAEFAVQYLVLAHAHAHPQLRDNAGNIALLHRAEAVGLLPAGIGQAAADAYRSLRRAQHQARLNEAPTQAPPEAFSDERMAIIRLTQAVL